MSIQSYSQADLGFRRVGPLPPCGGGFGAAAVAGMLAEYGDYEIASNCWVRRRGRRIGAAVPPLLEIAAQFDRASKLDDKSLGFIDQYLESPFRNFQARFTGEYADLLAIFGPEAERMDIAHVFTKIGQALCFAGPSRLRPLFRDHAAPWFFRRYPEGRIAVLRYCYRFFEHAALVRAVYTMAHNSFDDLKRLDINHFLTLRQWQQGHIIGEIHALLDQISFLWFPYVTGFQCGPLGLTFLFLPEPAEEYRLGPFPRDWLSIAASHGDFAGEDLGGSDVLNHPDSPAAWNLVHRRHRSPSPPSAADRLTFLEWYIARIDRLFYELTDLANFNVRNDPLVAIDPVTPFEHLLTIGRLIRQTLSVVSLDQVSARKAMAFEIADIYDTLSKLFGNTQRETDFFKLLFDPRRGPAEIGPRLATLPAPIGSILLDRMTSLYAELEQVILNSVWLRSKRVAGGVSVRSAKHAGQEKIEPNHEFVSNVLRAYRNAHHGYFTRSDPQMRPSRYLYLVDGNVPDSITALPPLWLLAYLADESLVGWHPLPVNAFS